MADLCNLCLSLLREQNLSPVMYSKWDEDEFRCQDEFRQTVGERYQRTLSEIAVTGQSCLLCEMIMEIVESHHSREKICYIKHYIFKFGLRSFNVELNFCTKSGAILASQEIFIDGENSKLLPVNINPFQSTSGGLTRKQTQRRTASQYQLLEKVFGSSHLQFTFSSRQGRCSGTAYQTIKNAKKTLTTDGYRQG